MKRILLLTACILITSFSFSKNIQAYLSYSTFLSPKDGPYIETYMSIYAKSIIFNKIAENKYQGSIGITMIFRQGKEVKNFKKYELKSPEVSDTTNSLDFSFIDQQRILLPNGEYEFELQVQDMKDSQPPIKDIIALKIDFPDGKINVSGIQLIESYKKTETPGILSKSGYDVVPYIHNYYPKSVNTITFYSEIYGTDKVLGADSKYLLSCFIQSNETGKTLSDLAKIRKETAKEVNIAFNDFDISKLPSGNYNLVIEVRNQKNEVIGSNSVFFQRSNPDIKLEIKDIAALNIQNTFVEKITNKDTLAEYIRCTGPISTSMEKVFVDFQLKTADLITMQQYFLNFWQKREDLSPERAWLAYLDQVKAVNKEYKTPIKKGYETDRGRTYLKYGPPNTITDQPFEASNLGSASDQNTNYYQDGGSVPYQIWHYYELQGHQRDKKFVFINSNLANNDYLLVHSNAIGEINNPNWQAELGRNTSLWDKDQVSPNNKYGGRSGDLFNHPR